MNISLADIWAVEVMFIDNRDDDMVWECSPTLSFKDIYLDIERYLSNIKNECIVIVKVKDHLRKGTLNYPSSSKDFLARFSNQNS